MRFGPEPSKEIPPLLQTLKLLRAYLVSHSKSAEHAKALSEGEICRPTGYAQALQMQLSCNYSGRSRARLVSNWPLWAGDCFRSREITVARIARSHFERLDTAIEKTGSAHAGAALTKGNLK